MRIGAAPEFGASVAGDGEAGLADFDAVYGPAGVLLRLPLRGHLRLRRVGGVTLARHIAADRVQREQARFQASKPEPASMSCVSPVPTIDGPVYNSYKSGNEERPGFPASLTGKLALHGRRLQDAV